MGIYVIRNLNTRKVYVGGSTWLEKRIEQHFSLLRSGRHPNQRLQWAVDASGIDRFEVQIVEVVDDLAVLAERELSWIKQENSVLMGYNKTYNTEHYGGPLFTQASTNNEISWKMLLAVGILVVIGALIFM